MVKKAETSAFHIHPTPGTLIVKSLIEDQVSGIYVADSTSNKESAGVVVAVGDADYEYHGERRSLSESPCKLGDKIIYASYSPNRYIDFETGDTLHFLKFKDVLGVIYE